jgi:hypothetical protein
VGSSLDTACGIRVEATWGRPTEVAVADLKKRLDGCDIQHLLVFFSGHDGDVLSAQLAAAFPGVPFSGCSTAGEITPAGMQQGTLQVMAFPRNGFRVLTVAIEGLDQLGVEKTSDIVRELKGRLGAGHETPSKERAFALMLVDGLSNVEEVLIAAVGWAMGDIQIIGGSAGDGLEFKRTTLLHDGRALTNAALLILVESNFPFRVFKSQNFEPTQTKLVVTAADAENRIVYELNAEPAAREYASAIGLLPNDLGPFSFASYPLVVKVGGNYYCRSIRNMNPDGSLAFFCAIDEGLVLTVARPQDMFTATADTLGDVDRSLGGIDCAIAFDCVLRRLDAENRQIWRQVDELYRKYRLFGFHTYGEQYNSMHLNQTLTGIAFGSRRT